MSTNSQCQCGTQINAIFACSGASTAGALADQAARKLARDGAGRMLCLAGIASRVPAIMKSTEAVRTILAIDGCPLSCTKSCLEEAGFSNFKHLQLTDIGISKDEAVLNDESITKVAAQGAALMKEVCS